MLANHGSFLYIMNRTPLSWIQVFYPWGMGSGHGFLRAWKHAWIQGMGSGHGKWAWMMGMASELGSMHGFRTWVQGIPLAC
jgi:hypothetical protein